MKDGETFTITLTRHQSEMLAMIQREQENKYPATAIVNAAVAIGLRAWLQELQSLNLKNCICESMMPEEKVVRE